MRGDWKDEAMQYRDVDKEAQRKAEEELERERSQLIRDAADGDPGEAGEAEVLRARDRGPRYPNIKVKLTGEDGNAFGIIGRVSKAMRRAKLTPEQVKEYQTEATAGDYDHLLATTMRYVEVS